VQKYRKKRGTFAFYLDAYILILQVAVVLTYALSILATTRLPASLRQTYNVYNDLQGAPARPLLPCKHSLGFAAVNETGYNGLDNGELLQCGMDVSSMGFVPPADIPRWALETDNSGLNDLVQAQAHHLLRN
jgi:hypothetical protein